MDRFNKEKDELLIELVKCNRVLYDPSDKNFKNNILKHKCWEKISRKIDISVGECKKRWKSLRDQYNKKKKLEKGTGTGQLNISRWEYMAIMSFLSDNMSERGESMSSVQEYAEIHMDHVQEDKQENEEDHEYTQENIQERSGGQGKLIKKKMSVPSLPLPQTPIRKFFDSMADTVECFPPNLQAEVRLKVCQLVTEAELRLYSQFQ